MPQFRREVPEYVPPYRRIPRDAPVGTYYCEPCAELHFPGDICWYYQYMDDFIEEERAIGDVYPEWSGSLSTRGYDIDCIFVDENGKDR